MSYNNLNIDNQLFLKLELPTPHEVLADQK